jgi:two-component system NarL family sensor kinase
MSSNLKTETDAEKLRRRNRELSILNAIAEALNRSVDLDQTLSAALAQVADLLDLQTGWIWLLDEKVGDSYLAASQNLPPALADNPRLMEGSCFCLDTYRAGDLDGAANINVITCSRLWGLVDGTDGLRYHASIPLYAHSKELGVLNVASTDWRQLTPDDLRLLATVGDLLSIAIERARLYAHSAEFGAAEERNRLAREIHDTLAQGLAGIALQLETAEALAETGGDSGPNSERNRQRIHQAIHQALALARANLDEARRSVLDLRAASLEGRDLAQALADLARSISVENALKVNFSVVGGNRPLPLRVESGLFRITQEALLNAAQHAGASQISLELISAPGRISLVIQDDGMGFDPGNIPAGRFGLVGLNERAKLLGGNLHIQSQPGAGTLVNVEVPL